MAQITDQTPSRSLQYRTAQIWLNLQLVCLIEDVYDSVSCVQNCACA